MATDYDAPRTNGNEHDGSVLESFEFRPNGQAGTVIDLDEAELADSYELPGGDVAGEELAVEIRPAQADEFTCSSCFLVRHRSQLARTENGLTFCRDCEG